MKKIHVCNCSLIRSAEGCDFPIACKEGPRCPVLYRSIGDALMGINPIAGSCISIGTGQSESCGCQYIY